MYSKFDSIALRKQVFSENELTWLALWINRLLNHSATEPAPVKYESEIMSPYIGHNKCLNLQMVASPESVNE